MIPITYVNKPELFFVLVNIIYTGKIYTTNPPYQLSTEVGG